MHSLASTPVSINNWTEEEITAEEGEEKWDGEEEATEEEGEERVYKNLV